MLKISKEVTIDDVAEVRKIDAVDFFEFSGDSWESCFAALTIWFQEHNAVLVGIDYYRDYEDDEYTISISVDDVHKK